MKRLSLALSFLSLVALAGAQEEQLPSVPPADAAAIQKINALGGGAMALAANTNLVSVNFSLAGSKIDDAALESLKGVSEQLVWLNLANTSVTDAGMKGLAGFKNLRRLHLEKTAVGDEGLASLKNLGELTYLNLYSTKVTDKGLSSLSGLKKLKNVYLWQTAVTDGGAAELAKAVPGIYINRGIDPPAKVVEIAAPPAPPPAAAPAVFTNTKEVMALHKGKESFLANILAGKGSDDDLKKLVGAYEVLAAQKAPKGDEGSWKNLTSALLTAAKEAQAKKDGALDKLKAASNCKACHEPHKPK
ncbi:MAG TPA: hypothetical protein VKU80_11195 [Planctomycetota bacterium]|nr:hypothetical protein [Planctomycetota bacterium]